MYGVLFQIKAQNVCAITTVGTVLKSLFFHPYFFRFSMPSNFILPSLKKSLKKSNVFFAHAETTKRLSWLCKICFGVLWLTQDMMQGPARKPVACSLWNNIFYVQYIGKHHKIYTIKKLEFLPLQIHFNIL